MPNKAIVASLFAALLPLTGLAQTDPGAAAILNRLDQLEKDNRQLREELQELRGELAASRSPAAAPVAPLGERLEVQERRTDELAQTKVESSQRMPVSLTGMLLFNAFLNGKHSGGSQDPSVAQANPGQASAGGSLRQTILGLKFNGPDLPGGGHASGTLYMDFFAGSRDPADHIFHLRTATLDLAWKNTTLTFGQDKPIYAPRDPDSLAQVGVSPLTAAGNLWDWQPQIRIEQRFAMSDRTGFRAQAGVYQTEEMDAFVPASYAKSLEHARPGFEGRVEFYHGDVNRRFEIAPGFHLSTTHVAGTSVPSKLASLDWLIRPTAAVEFTGALFRGENVANQGALRQGFTVLAQGNAIPIRSYGGWGQVAWFAKPRLTLHIYGGQEHDNESDLRGAGLSRNFIYAGNAVYKLAPNVLASFEVSQVRTRYIVNGLRINNHYDLAIAYLF